MAPDHRPPADAAATGLGRMAKPAGQTSRRSPWSSGRNQEAQCPACAAPVNAGDRYCEACGQELGAPVVAAPVVVAPGAVAPGALVVGAYGLDAGTGQWLSSADPSAPCPGCGSTVFSPDGFCDGCGQRRPTAKNHSELDLGTVAGVTDLGNRHHRNEDALAIGVLDGVVVTVVCDGVSSSSRPDTASHAAVDAAAPARPRRRVRRRAPRRRPPRWSPDRSPGPTRPAVRSYAPRSPRSRSPSAGSATAGRTGCPTATGSRPA